MKNVGLTSEGKIVVSDVYKYVDTHGIPLDNLIETIIIDYGFEIDWFDFVVKSLSNGWNVKTLLSRFEYAVKDVFGNCERSIIMINSMNEMVKNVTRNSNS